MPHWLTTGARRGALVLACAAIGYAALRCEPVAAVSVLGAVVAATMLAFALES